MWRLFVLVLPTEIDSLRGSISVGIRVGAPAEPRQGFHHHFLTTHATPTTKNGSRKKMTA